MSARRGTCDLVVRFLTCSLIRVCDVRLICWCLALVTDRRGEESLESESDSSCVVHTQAATAALSDREKVGTQAYLTTKI